MTLITQVDVLLPHAICVYNSYFNFWPEIMGFLLYAVSETSFSAFQAPFAGCCSVHSLTDFLNPSKFSLSLLYSSNGLAEGLTFTPLEVGCFVESALLSNGRSCGRAFRHRICDRPPSVSSFFKRRAKRSLHAGLFIRIKDLFLAIPGALVISERAAVHDCRL